jgi:hypothetical protein
MDAKLTLKLNDNVIERAKIYARSHKISLSKMIESYLDSITKQKENEKGIEKVAINALKMGKSIPDIIELTGLSKEQIERLK